MIRKASVPGEPVASGANYSIALMHVDYRTFPETQPWFQGAHHGRSSPKLFYYRDTDSSVVITESFTITSASLECLKYCLEKICYWITILR